MPSTTTRRTPREVRIEEVDRDFQLGRQFRLPIVPSVEAEFALRDPTAGSLEHVQIVAHNAIGVESLLGVKPLLRVLGDAPIEHPLGVGHVALRIDPSTEVEDHATASLLRCAGLRELQSQLRFADAASADDGCERARQKSPAEAFVKARHAGGIALLGIHRRGAGGSSSRTSTGARACGYLRAGGITNPSGWKIFIFTTSTILSA